MHTLCVITWAQQLNPSSGAGVQQEVSVLPRCFCLCHPKAQSAPLQHAYSHEGKAATSLALGSNLLLARRMKSTCFGYNSASPAPGSLLAVLHNSTYLHDVGAEKPRCVAFKGLAREGNARLLFSNMAEQVCFFFLCSKTSLHLNALHSFCSLRRLSRWPR